MLYKIRRHLLFIGVSLLILSNVLLIFNLSESKLGLNSTNEIELKYYIHNIKGLGEETFKQLNNFDKSIYSLEVDSKRLKLINKNFKSGDNMLRLELFKLSLIIMITLNVLSIIILVKLHIRKLYNRIVLGSGLNIKKR